MLGLPPEARQAAPQGPAAKNPVAVGLEQGLQLDGRNLSGQPQTEQPASRRAADEVEVRGNWPTKDLLQLREDRSGLQATVAPTRERQDVKRWNVSFGHGAPPEGRRKLRLADLHAAGVAAHWRSGKPGNGSVGT